MDLEVQKLLEKADGNFAIFDSVAKAHSVLSRYDSIACSISGGKDSDIMLDLISKIDKDRKVRYIWFDTGLEYQATKDHLKYLEEKYHIEIERIKAIKPIPLSCSEYGQPFLSKFVSDMISRLQRHGFTWEDKPIEQLLAEYPKAQGAINWWCNGRNKPGFKTSIFNINYHKYLKEFMIENPPWFKISSKCCTYAKKEVSAQFIKDNYIDLMIIGVRKAEKGIRSASYKTCFTAREDECDQYRPLFWYSDKDEVYYDELFDIQHSDCYTKYGMTRTGCVGCPFNRKLLDELSIIEEHEPKMLKVVSHVFKDSYEYTRMFREYVQKRKNEEKERTK